jgi:transcriptional regulator with XRE-family HTH domain
MTQQDLAHIIGVTYQQIQKYESGTSRITASKLLMCSVKTGQSLDYFLKAARDHLQQAYDANNQ